jgi:hypothetical protein
MLIGFSVLGVVALTVWERPVLGYALFGAGALLGGLGLTGTSVGRPGYWLWMGFAFVMGNIVSRVLIAIVYFGPVTLVGLLQRSIGRDRLRLRRQNVASYWQDLPEAPKERERYERQY